MAKAKVILELSLPELELILQALKGELPKERKVDAELLAKSIRRKASNNQKRF